MCVDVTTQVHSFNYFDKRKMSNYEGDAPAEYMDDVDDEMEDVGDDMDEEFRADDDDDDLAASDSDVEEFDYSVCLLVNLICCLYAPFWTLLPLTYAFVFQNNKIADTSAEQARKGKDIQGIPWDRLSISRDKYRQTRLLQYKNYENVPNSGQSSHNVTKNKRLFCLFSTGASTLLN